jgi:hypothetical protein
MLVLCCHDACQLLTARPPPTRLEAKVKERTEADLRGLVVELVAVDQSGVDQLSSLEQPEVHKMWSIFSHQKLDLADIVIQVCAMSFASVQCG